MIVEVYDDAAAFAEVAEAHIAADPIRTTVLATVLADVTSGARSYEGALWLAAIDGTDVVGVAMLTPPYSTWLSPMPAEAAELVADTLHTRLGTRALPGINGHRPAAETAAARWTDLRPDELAREVRANRLYALGTLWGPPEPPGQSRLAAMDDVDLLVAWFTAFSDELDMPMPDIRSSVAARLAGHGALALWEHDGQPLSLAGCTTRVAGTVRVGPVYTPPEHRGHGYGSAATFAITQFAVGGGATQVVLFTDLGNPTSNSIYQRLGYRPAGDYVELALSN